MNTPLISLIIPCYNAQDFVFKTLESVFLQTYTNWECIIVDDGSKDNSKDSIKKWTEKDSRFIYHYQKNGGISNARNTGFKLSKGEFIYFLDSDDLISEDALESLKNLFTNDIDIVFGKTAITDGQNKDIKGFLDHNLTTGKTLSNNNKKLLPLVADNYLICTVHNRLYRKTLLLNNDISFNEDIVHEDELYFFETLFFAKNIVLNNKPTYFYVVTNPNSFINNFTINNVNSYLTILNYIYQNYYLNEKHDSYKEAISVYLTYFKIVIINHCLKNSSKEILPEVKTLIKLQFNTILPARTSTLLSDKREKEHYFFTLLSLFNQPTFYKYVNYTRSKNITKQFKKWFIIKIGKIKYNKKLNEIYKVK